MILRPPSEHPIEAYAVPPSKKLARASVLAKAAALTVTTYVEIARRSRLSNGPALIDGSIEKFVAEYFSAVARFKQQHGFKPGERINQSKIAALIVNLLAHRDPSDFFVVPAAWSGTDDELLLHFEFIFNCMRAILFIEELPHLARQELLICIRNMEETSIEWLIVTMRFLCDGHGMPDDGLGD